MRRRKRAEQGFRFAVRERRCILKAVSGLYKMVNLGAGLRKQGHSDKTPTFTKDHEKSNKNFRRELSDEKEISCGHFG